MTTLVWVRQGGTSTRLLAAVMLLLPGCASAPRQVAPAVAQRNHMASRSIYDAGADARAQIGDALRQADRDNQRVLLVFGADWCGWCRKLHRLFHDDAGIARILLYEYQVVPVGVGRLDKHLDVAAEFGVDLRKTGIPFLTVLDSHGRVLTNQETGALEKGDGHDPEKVAAFLNTWKAEPQDARAVVDDALQRARMQNKRVFLRIGAPWCHWCRRLDDFVRRPDIAGILELDFVDVKIDVDRMAGAASVVSRFRGSGQRGIPWFAFLDARGDVIATSDRPAGTIGFPVEPAEIDHFVGMLEKSTRAISADQIARIRTVLNALADELKHPSGRAGNEAATQPSEGTDLG